MGLSHSPRMVTNGLQLCLDAGNARSYPGSGTTWTDLIGSGNNGTLTNGPTFSSTNGGSVVFDGVNDYVAFGDVFDLGTNDLTVNVWVKPTTLTAATNYTIMSKAIAFTQNYRYSVGFSGSAVYGFMQGNGGADIFPIGSTTINTNTWYMCTYVFTRSSSISMYVNGNLETPTGSATISQWNALDFQSSNPFRIAAYTSGDNTTPSSFFSGTISVFQMYFRSLSAAEIRQNFNALRGRYGI
jgi:hypothetical protein